MNELSNYLYQISNSIQKRQDLSPFFRKTENSITSGINLNNLKGGYSQIRNKLDENYSEMIVEHLESYKFLCQQDFVQAYLHQKSSFESFATIFKESTPPNDPQSWLVKVLFVLISDMNIFARKADEEEKRKGKTRATDYLVDSCTELMTIFRVCGQDRSTKSQMVATLGVANNLFKCYFSRNNLSTCKSLFETITNKENELSRIAFPQDQLVTYRYYEGKYAIFEGQFKKAQASLLYAFVRCPPHQKNKRLILLHLIPVEFFVNGKAPDPKLLEKYRLSEYFEAVLNASMTGNIAEFNLAVQKNEDWYIQKGIYLVIEKMRWIAYRNFIKKIYNVLTKDKLITNTQIQIDKYCLPFLKKYDPNSNTICIDELVVIIANLIHIGYIKGYISQKSNTLVVSKSNPFPPIKAVTTG
jgi:hypothetical protein